MSFRPAYNDANLILPSREIGRQDGLRQARAWLMGAEDAETLV